MSNTLSIQILEKYKKDIFVETGSFHGGGIHKAMALSIPEIYSIDSYEFYYNSCMEVYGESKPVHLYLGNSGKILYNIIKDINQEILFWLDAHSETDTPILDELDQISRHSIKTHTIMIDDYRLFGTDFKVRPIDLVEKIYSINKDYNIIFENSLYCDEDILVAITK